MDPMFQIIAIFCTGTFFGMSIYISLIQHPSTLSIGADCANMFFKPLYLKTAPVLLMLTMLGSFAGIFQWFLSADIWWLIASICLFFVTPYTLLVIKPTSDALLEENISSDESERLLIRWGKLHSVRSIAGCIAFLIFLLDSHW